MKAPADKPLMSLPQRLVLNNRFLAEDSKQILSSLIRYCALRLREYRCRILRGHLIRKKRIKSYMMKNGAKKLHLGAGDATIDGFLNSDMLGEIPINICRKLPFRDNAIDLIYTSHLVEHIHKEDFKFFLAESLRVLKLGGLNIVATPTIEKAAAIAYGNDENAIRIVKDSHSRFMKEDFFTASEYLNQLMRAFDHKWLYDLYLIEKLGTEAGFQSVRKIPNLDVPDAVLRDYLMAKPPDWHLETETFLLRKGPACPAGETNTSRG